MAGISSISTPATQFAAFTASQDSQLLGGIASAPAAANFAGITNLNQNVQDAQAASMLPGAPSPSATSTNLAGITNVDSAAQQAQTASTVPLAPSPAGTFVDVMAGQDSQLLNGVSSSFSTYS